jgi:hypothetical protein
VKVLAGLLLAAIIVTLIVLHNSNENGLSGVWDEITGGGRPEVNRVELDVELDVSTP